MLDYENFVRFVINLGLAASRNENCAAHFAHSANTLRMCFAMDIAAAGCSDVSDPSSKDLRPCARPENSLCSVQHPRTGRSSALSCDLTITWWLMSAVLAEFRVQYLGGAGLEEDTVVAMLNGDDHWIALAKYIRVYWQYHEELIAEFNWVRNDYSSKNYVP